MQSLDSEISAAIVAAGGAISFEKFMELALYAPAGFYSTEVRAGRRGDFITSPEVGPLFGAVVAKSVDAQWRQLGRPKKFELVEVGAGPGTLARSILSAELECRDALRYVAVEVSDVQRRLHTAEMHSQSTLPTEPMVGMIIANELLDNLPFRLFVFDGVWQEAFVAKQGESFVEVLRRVNDAPEWLPQVAPHGARVPVQNAAAMWLGSCLELLQSGSITIFDYCSTSSDAISNPWRDWLRTYRQHEQGEHYLRHPGSQDITSHVMIDQLQLVRQADRVETQADWLIRNGINQLVEDGRNYWQANAAKPDVKAMKMRSRVSESEALCDPNGLGNFKVLEWHK
ncbi:MAG: SAM-dependent methyltransferase [Ilumatobacteraceae bacterium]